MKVCTTCTLTTFDNNDTVFQIFFSNWHFATKTDDTYIVHCALLKKKETNIPEKRKNKRSFFSLNSTKKTTSWAQSCQHNILEKGNRAEEEFEDGAFHCFMTGPMGLTDLKIKMPVHCSGINKRHLSGLSKQSFTIKLNTYNILYKIQLQKHYQKKYRET